MNVAILEMSETIHEIRLELQRAVQEVQRLQAENETLKAQVATLSVEE